MRVRIGRVASRRKKKGTKVGEKISERKRDDSVEKGGIARGRLLSSESLGSFSFTGRLARPIDRRLELINLFKLDGALIDDHSTNTFYNSTVSLESNFFQSRIERPARHPSFPRSGSSFYRFSTGAVGSCVRSIDRVDETPFTHAYVFLFRTDSLSRKYHSRNHLVELYRFTSGDASSFFSEVFRWKTHDLAERFNRGGSNQRVIETNRSALLRKVLLKFALW